MWGPAIVGFGEEHLKYESGRELDIFVMRFSPRKQSLTLYISGAMKDQKNLLAKLGKHKTSKACLYINKLEDIDMAILKKIIQEGAKPTKKPT